MRFLAPCHSYGVAVCSKLAGYCCVLPLVQDTVGVKIYQGTTRAAVAVWGRTGKLLKVCLVICAHAKIQWLAMAGAGLHVAYSCMGLISSMYLFEGATCLIHSQNRLIILIRMINDLEYCGVSAGQYYPHHV
jgi:hypothetical protein